MVSEVARKDFAIPSTASHPAIPRFLSARCRGARHVAILDLAYSTSRAGLQSRSSREVRRRVLTFFLWGNPPPTKGKGALAILSEVGFPFEWREVVFWRFEQTSTFCGDFRHFFGFQFVRGIIFLGGNSLRLPDKGGAVFVVSFCWVEF